MRPQEPDPADEFFDVVDENGNPTGEVKKRSDVHQDGDWHCAFHCWVALRNGDGDASVLFQRRSINKDTYPGKLDVAVGGHYRSGEGFEDVVREVEEELGISPPNRELVPVGRRWAESITDAWIDREIEDVFVYCLVEPVATLAPSYEEITAVDVITARNIEKLFSGSVQRVESERHCVTPENALAEPVTAHVALEDFIPVTDRYWPAGTCVAVAILDGMTHAKLELVS